MARPDLPKPEAFKHGTRARYVTGCRCRPCTHANVLVYYEREAAAKAAALELDQVDGGPSPQAWTAPDGTKKVRIYKRACPGINGEPCPHGSHLRKDSTGGICGRCRSKLVWNGLVPAKAARHHIVILSNRGVGYKSVADAACVSVTVVYKIMSGKKKRIRAKTSRSILEVDTDAIADHALVNAKPVWKMIDILVRKHGFTHATIAQRLGYARPLLQFGKKKVLAKTKLKVARLLADANGDFLRR